jgi:hypothetical protein
MRTTAWTSGASGVASPPTDGPVTIEEIVRPGNRRVIQMVGGVVVDEQMAIDGRVYLRGAIVPAAVAPMMDASTWVEINPAAADSSSPIAALVAYLTSPVSSPLGEVSEETRNLMAVPAGQSTIAGRTCDVFTFGFPDRITYELALEANGLPCRFVTSAGGQANVTLYEFDPPGLSLVAPDVATPPSSDGGTG